MSAELVQLSREVLAKVIPIITLGSLALGCGNGPETSQSPRPDSDRTEYTADSASIYLCGPNKSGLIEVLPGNKLEKDTEDIFCKEDNRELLSDAEINTLTEDLRTEYGVNLSFPEQPLDVPGYEFWAISPNATERRGAVTAAIQSVAEAVQLFSPKMLKERGELNIVYVGQIIHKYNDIDSGVGLAGGLYHAPTNTLYITAVNLAGAYANTLPTVVHELTHLIIEKDDSNFPYDEFVKFNTQPYRTYTEQSELVDEAYYTTTTKREFVRLYGSTKAYEDRATLWQWTVTERGLILEGDPDWNSPLAKKQAVLVGYLELHNPGTRSYLEKLTVVIRADRRDQNTLP